MRMHTPQCFDVRMGAEGHLVGIVYWRQNAVEICGGVPKEGTKTSSHDDGMTIGNVIVRTRRRKVVSGSRVRIITVRGYAL